MKNNNYYDKGKHRYMYYETDDFANHIFSLIYDDSFGNYDTAVEIGTGMGRFSASVIKNFSNVTLVEPSQAYSEVLKNRFSKSNVFVVNTTAENFLENYETDKPIIIFGFHIMHHLRREQRNIIYHFVKQTGSKCVMIEPNPYNPMIFMQILLNPDMSLSEEMQYLNLTRRKYEKEVEENSLVLSVFKRLCFFPPFVTNFFLNKLPSSVFDFFEASNRFFPFLGSYQLITFEEKTP